jgi:hypothetical protein
MLVDWSFDGPVAGIGAQAKIRANAPGAQWMDIEVLESLASICTVEETDGKRRTGGTYTLDELPGGVTDIYFQLEVVRAPLSERFAAPLLVRTGPKRVNVQGDPSALLRHFPTSHRAQPDDVTERRKGLRAGGGSHPATRHATPDRAMGVPSSPRLRFHAHRRRESRGLRGCRVSRLRRLRVEGLLPGPTRVGSRGGLLGAQDRRLRIFLT